MDGTGHSTGMRAQYGNASGVLAVQDGDMRDMRGPEHGSVWRQQPISNPTQQKRERRRVWDMVGVEWMIGDGNREVR